MKKTLIRFYDVNDPSSITGEKLFLVLDCSYDDLSDDDFMTIICSITSMKWQNYNKYMVGEADLSDSKLYWSEIMDYEMHEVCIDCDKVENKKYYNFPKMFRWWED